MRDVTRTANRTESRRRCTRRALGLGIGFSAAVFLLWACLVYVTGDPLPQVTVSPETTHWTEPLDKTGFVDFEAIAESLQPEPIPPEANAAVPLIRAFGVEALSNKPNMPPDAAQREEFFDLLGVDDPGVAAYVTWEDFAHQRGWDTSREAFWADDGPFTGFIAELVKCEDAPWTPEQYPDVASWVEENAAALNLIEEAAALPRFWCPQLQEASSAILYGLRDSYRLLRIRAMLSVGTGDVAGALENAMSCHRLARLVHKTPPVLAMVGGIADSNALYIESTVIVAGDLSADESQEYLAKLNALPPIPDWCTDRTVDIDWRLPAVWALSETAHEAKLAEASRQWGDKRFSDVLDAVPARLVNAAIDWDAVLRFTNDQYDLYAAVLLTGSYSARIAAVTAIDHDLREIAHDVHARSPEQELNRALRRDHRNISRRVAIREFPIGQIAYTIEGIYRIKANLPLARGGFAVMAYRAERGKFPHDLSALVPGYLPEVPLDPYTDKPLVYDRTESGLRLYSVGKDMVDNGGTNYEDVPQADDVRIEFTSTGRSND